MDRNQAIQQWEIDTAYLAATIGEDRVEEWSSAMVAIYSLLDQYGLQLQPPAQGINRWISFALQATATGEVLIAVIKNGSTYQLYFMRDFFNAHDRKQVYSRLGPPNESNPPPNAVAFGQNLGALFYLRDMMEDRVISGPLTKQLLRDGQSPEKIYVQFDHEIKPFDEEIDEAFRGKRLRKVIETLVKTFTPKHRDYWRYVFQHIADGGDGNVRQKREKRTPAEDYEEAKIKWEEARLKGWSQLKLANKMGISLSTLQRRLSH